MFDIEGAKFFRVHTCIPMHAHAHACFFVFFYMCKAQKKFKFVLEPKKVLKKCGSKNPFSQLKYL